MSTISTIHTVGDSHSLFGWKDLKKVPVKINHLGPRLMYTFGTSAGSIVDESIIRTLSLHDLLVFCFGEIDCRCHIHKHVSSEVSYHTIIEQIVDSYIAGILNLRTKYSLEAIKIAAYSVVPPIRRIHGVENTSFPFLGNDTDRLNYQQYMNMILRKKCIDNNVIFFDVTGYYADSEGFLIKELSDNICHINGELGITRVLEDMNLI